MHYLNALLMPLQVGDDVEFTLVRDSQAAAKGGGAKKLAAVRWGAFSLRRRVVAIQ